MKVRFTILLLVLNAAALAAALVYFNQRKAEELSAARAAAASDLEAWKARARAVAVAAAPEVVYRANAFRWSDLESTDYRQFIANLRAVGCPEGTIKDIILTDVMRLYAARRGQLYHNGHDFKFWETDDKRRLKQTQLDERDRQLAQIDKELPAVLRELLGVNYEREVNKYFVDTDEDNRRLSFLSDDQRDAALSLREKFEGQRESVYFHVSNGTLSDADVEQLRKIDEDEDAAFSTTLSADDKAQYDLSMSPTADRLRAALIGFDPNEQEFRDLFRRWQTIDASYEFQNPNDPSAQAARAADEQAALDEFKATLTPDRAAQLVQSEDPDYRDLVSLAARFDLPADTSQTILDMRQTAETQRRQLLSIQNLSPDRLEIALKAIQDETQKAARQTLGDQAYAQYAQTAAWLRQLTAPQP